MENQSLFNDKRKTVGAISQEIRNTDTTSMQIGDVNHEMLKGFIDDINSALTDGRIQFPGKTFFVVVTEKWEYQLKNALCRKVAIFQKRPYPEANTTCFKYDHEKNDVKFCWDLPLRHEMWNVMSSSEIFDPQTIADVKAWEANELEHFGLMKAGIGDHWVENPHFKDREMSEYKPQFKILT